MDPIVFYLKINSSDGGSILADWMIRPLGSDLNGPPRSDPNGPTTDPNGPPMDPNGQPMDLNGSILMGPLGSYLDPLGS